MWCVRAPICARYARGDPFSGPLCVCVAVQARMQISPRPAAPRAPGAAAARARESRRNTRKRQTKSKPVPRANAKKPKLHATTDVPQAQRRCLRSRRRIASQLGNSTVRVREQKRLSTYSHRTPVPPPASAHVSRVSVDSPPHLILHVRQATPRHTRLSDLRATAGLKLCILSASSLERAMKAAQRSGSA